MKKTIILFLMITLLFPLANAAIQNYRVPSQIPLNEVLSIDGKISTDQNGVKCSFQIYDTNGNLIDRLTDEYTAGSGIFSSAYYKVSEPKFLRSFDYNAVTTCNSDRIGSVFTVGQKQVLLAHELNQESGFIGSSGNIDSTYLIGSIILFIILILFIGYSAYLKVKN